MQRIGAGRLISILVVVGALSVAQSARAIGWGGYLGFTHSEGNVEGDVFGFDIDADHDNEIFDTGFSFDTNLASDQLTNFRLYAGIQVGKRDYEGFKEETVGMTIAGTLGFSLHRSSNMRVWLGPSLRFSIDGCTDCSGYDSTFVAFGGGLELGVNFNLDSRVTISPSISYQLMYGADVVDVDDLDSETFDGLQHHVSLLLTIYFRSRSDNF